MIYKTQQDTEGEGSTDNVNVNVTGHEEVVEEK